MPFRSGDSVYVQKKELGLDPNEASPFQRTEIVRRHRRSATLRLPDGMESGWIATSKLRKNIGVLIIRIGDYEETTLLDPLFKSVLNFCRILLPDDQVLAIEIRTLTELEFFWNRHHHNYEQIVLIAHGSSEGLVFGEREIQTKYILKILRQPNPGPKEFISLCCQTGKQKFAKSFSKERFCSGFIAPFHSVHGCISSMFCQHYLVNRMLKNLSVGIAAKQAREKLLGAASFRLWTDGKKKLGT